MAKNKMSKKQLRARKRRNVIRGLIQEGVRFNPKAVSGETLQTAVNVRGSVAARTELTARATSGKFR
jgi:hypothetical protein